jgi:type II secretory ATPase GspE/PulE/Tfp pilus assembly ATPase PilB-like protein
VFSTLHTIDASSTVTRLYDLGISPRMFADALSLVVAQRLIRLVCPECKKPDRPDASVLREIGIREGEEGGYPFMIGKGCRYCNNMGYYGRSGIFEILAPNAQIRSALEQGNHSTAELRELAVSNGMRTLREESLVLLKQGLTTAEEVLRVTK